MISKRELIFWAKQIEILHILIFIITVIFMFTIFLSVKYKLISAIWLFLLYLIGRIYSLCPLTRIENILLIMAGVKTEKGKFIPRFFEKKLKIYIPDWLAEIALLGFFVIATYIIISYLITELQFSPIY